MPRPRFSLRTLLLFVLLLGSGSGLWWRWEPWVKIAAPSWIVGYSQCPPVLYQEVDPDERRLLDLATFKLHTVVKAVAKGGSLPELTGSPRYLVGMNVGTLELTDNQTGKKETLPFQYDFTLHAHVTVTPNERWLMVSEPPTLYDLAARKIIFREERPAPVPGKTPAILSEEQQRSETAGVAAAHACKKLDQFLTKLPAAPRVRFWFSNFGAHLLTSVQPDALQVWDTDTGSLLATMPIEPESISVVCLLSPDGSRLAVFPRFKKGVTKIYDVPSGRRAGTLPGIPVGYRGRVSDARGQRWIISDNAGGSALADVDKGLLYQMPENFGTISLDGTRLYKPGPEKMEVLDVDSGECLHVFPYRDGGQPMLSGDRLVFFNALWSVEIHEQRRAEGLRGLLQLPEFWLTVVFALALLASLRADFRALRAKQAMPPAPAAAG